MPTNNVIPLPMAPWGAAPGDWMHFDLILGLTADLLPVVSNPHAVKSPESKLQGPGKTPSRYNRKGHMAGIAEWTSRATTPEQVAQWAQQPDYGICVQTRRVRAIDVDVAEAGEAEAIGSFVAQRLGRVLPTRYRSNSSKFLLAVALPGEMNKRRFKTTNGIVEFLANGQQFVAVGTHTSGVRYEWLGGLPNSVPELDLGEFEALWAALVEHFGTEDSVEATPGAKPLIDRAAADAQDDMIGFLHDNWTVKGVDRRTGRVDILCPFEDGHSTESGDSSTSYFPAGVGAFQQGHFKCQHASCAHRTDADFIEAVGYIAADFAVIPQAPLPVGAQPAPPPPITTPEHPSAFDQARGKDGRITPSRETVRIALERPDICGFVIGRDTFREEIMLSPPGSGAWRSFEDKDYYDIAMGLEKGQCGFKHIPRDLMRDAVDSVSATNRFDSAQVWLYALKWDGVKRVDRFLPDYFAAEDRPYTRAVGRYLWTALAGRIITPGCQADMVPIAIGEQGARKTTAVSAMSPAPEFHCELDLGADDDNIARMLRGKLICELGEMKGMRKKEIEHLKAQITRRTEKWTPKFKEFNALYHRRCVFIGTTNNDVDPLPHDSSGYRRWLPFRVMSGRQCDVDGIIRDREQLWAEAATLYLTLGVAWQDAEELARVEHSEFTSDDSWIENISNWLESADLCEVPPKDRPFLRISEVITGAIGKPTAQINRADERHAGNILKSLGYSRAFRGGARVWVKL